MPIYEFYCEDCHRIFNFLSRAVNTEKRPACPRCGRPELARRASSFAISRGRKEESAQAKEGPPEVDDARLAKAMESLAREAEGINEDDPRQAGRLMRRLFQAAGLPMGAQMEEALRRMEAGEDPEKVEEELGDVFGEGPFGDAEGAEATESAEGARAKTRLGRLASLRRRALPPSVDPRLYEL